MSAEKISIAVVDDQQLFRDGISGIIEKSPDIALDLIAESADAFLAQLRSNSCHPQIVLLDLSMPGINGIELHEILQKEYPSIKVIVLSAYDQPRFVNKMIEKGASGFLSKNCGAAELLNAIRMVAEKGFYFNETIILSMQQERNKNSSSIKNINNIPVELTKREAEILVLICHECTTEEIAARLYVSTRTVEGHRLNLLSKTGCRNTAGLVVFAIKNNIYNLIS